MRIINLSLPLSAHQWLIFLRHFKTHFALRGILFKCRFLGLIPRNSDSEDLGMRNGMCILSPIHSYRERYLAHFPPSLHAIVFPSLYLCSSALLSLSHDLSPLHAGLSLLSRHQGWRQLPLWGHTKAACLGIRQVITWSSVQPCPSRVTPVTSVNRFLHLKNGSDDIPRSQLS